MEEEVADTLKKALTSPKKRTVERFIKWCLESFVNDQNLRYAIDNEVDILTTALNHYGLAHTSLTPIFRTVLRAYWDEVESYFINVEKVLKTLSRKPGCEKILKTERGIRYLNNCCKNSYETLYNFVWVEE